MSERAAKGEAAGRVQDEVSISRPAKLNSTGCAIRDVGRMEKWSGLDDLLREWRKLGWHAHERRIGPDERLHLRHVRPVHEELVADRMHEDRDPRGLRHHLAQG
ncbi:hypothetical protein [Geminicoccus harenae]|uniref:hypothetical protein n=1 Tax=Geminicoccus harenae TaxID=2498453 RepID=UPI00168B998A|nr:hypothetical protein [Geminicoccus harenae]